MDMYGMGGMGGGGGQQQQMMMSMSFSCVCVVGIGALAWALMSKSSSQQDPIMPPSPDMAMTAPPEENIMKDGLYNIKYGDMAMASSSKECARAGVGFVSSKEADKQAWNFKAVPNRPGFYWISSENRGFAKTCESRFLTAADDCKGSPMLDKAGKADSQYWKLVPGSSEGRYMLQNSACTNKRQNDLLFSSGSKAKWNGAQMTKISGSPYQITPWV